MGNYIYMNIFKKKFQKIQKPLDASLFCVYLLKVPTFTRGNFYTLEMQLLCLTKSSQDSFLHMRSIKYDVGWGHTYKFDLKLLLLLYLRVSKIAIFAHFEGFLIILGT